jgi:hypothetical protein
LRMRRRNFFPGRRGGTDETHRSSCGRRQGHGSRAAPHRPTRSRGARAPRSRRPGGPGPRCVPSDRSIREDFRRARAFSQESGRSFAYAQDKSGSGKQQEPRNGAKWETKVQADT